MLKRAGGSFCRLSVFLHKVGLVQLIVLAVFSNAELEVCPFNDYDLPTARCKVQLAGEAHWAIDKAKNVKGDYLPHVDADNSAEGSYAYLQMIDHVTNPGALATIDMPLLGKDDNAKCLKLSYAYFGQLLAPVKLVRSCHDDSSMPEDARGTQEIIWQLDGTSIQPRDFNFPWTHIEIPLYHDNKTPLDKCTLTLLANPSLKTLHGAIAFDKIIASTCSWLRPNICTFDEACQHWKADASAWNIEMPQTVSAIPFDDTYQSAEGKFLAMTTPQSGCYSARLIGIRLADLLAPSTCLTFVANAFNYESVTDQVADFYVHISDTNNTVISTPWSTKLFWTGAKFFWSKMYAFIDVSDSVGLMTTETGNYRFILEVRYCSEKGHGGVAIDSLSALNYSISHCRRQGDDSFEQAGTFWEPTDVDSLNYNWIVVPALQKGIADHTFSEDINKGKIFVTDNEATSISRMQSSSTLAPTHARCVTFWLYTFPDNYLKAYIQRVDSGGSIAGATVWNLGLPEFNDWQLSSFSYFAPYYHRIVFEAKGQVFMDDITITDGACACRPIQESDSCAVPQLDKLTWLPGEITSYYSRIGDCPDDVPTLEGGTYVDVTLPECARHCETFEKENCWTLVYAEATRACQLKGTFCPILKPSLDKRTYEKENLPNFYGQYGECTTSAISVVTGRTSPESCADECFVNTACSTFVFGRIESTCWLHSNCPSLKAAPDRRAYEMIEFRGYRRYAGSCDAEGHSTVERGISRRACAYKCMANTSCSAFVYNPTKQVCNSLEAKTCATDHEPVADTFTYIKTSISSYSCDFEEFDNCLHNGYQPSEGGTGFDFQVVSSRDGYSFNGPKRDATWNKDFQGHYLLLTNDEASAKEGQNAQLATPVLDPKLASCLTFRYYLFGPAVGSFEVYKFELGIQELSLIWKAEHTQTDQWLEGHINLARLGINNNYLATRKLAYFGAVAIDDIFIAAHDCFPSPGYSCNFESYDSCKVIKSNGFTTPRASDFNFTDHTYNSGYGHFVSAEQLNTNGPAVLGIDYHAKYDQCATFWYRRGSACVQLRAGLKTSQFRRGELVTPRSKDDSDDWIQATVHLPGGYADDVEGHLSFHAEGFGCDSSKDSWLILDDIVVLEKGCHRKASCNFDSEAGHCLYETVDNRPLLMPWLYGNANGLSRIPAPPTDNTFMDPDMGGFMFVDQLSRADLPKIAGLKSPWAPTLSDQITVTFFYSLTGPESGVLEVLVSFRSNSTMWVPMWGLVSNDREPSWKFGRFSFSIDKPDFFQVYFRGTRGTNSYAVLAVDDVVIMPGIVAGLYPPSADPRFPPTTPQPISSTTPITPYPTFAPSELVIDCNFETSMCGFTTTAKTGFSWVCNLAGNCEAPLGPFLDHTTGTTSGRYIYTESQYLGSLTVNAELEKEYSSEKAGCLSYWYISYGGNVPGISTGYRMPNFATKYDVYVRKGSQSGQWQYVEHYMPPSTTDGKTYARLATERGQKVYGNVAFDDVRLSNSECPPRPNECTFDANYPGNPCDSSSTGTRDAQWRISPREMSVFVADHTYQTTFGRFAFVLTGWTKSFDNVNLTIPFDAPSASSTYCLQFWYQLGGTKPGTLSVFFNNNLIFGTLPFSGTSWSMARGNVNVPGGGGKWAPVFVAGYTYSGGGSVWGQLIQIDDIQVLTHPCDSQGDGNKCTFENGQCGWTNDDGANVQVDWLLGSGLYGGPIPHDHTFNRSDGHYMYLQFSPPLSRGSRARLFGPQPYSGAKCLSFSYYIKVSSSDIWSTLRILAVTEDSEFSLWLDDSNTYGLWVNATVPIDEFKIVKPYELAFESYFDSPHYDGIIGIDDVEITDKKCDRYPSGHDSEPSRYTPTWIGCPFDTDFCQWKAISNIPNAQWSLENDRLDNLPSAIISYSRITGAFNATLTSRWLAPKGPSTKYCVSFSYAFHGLNPGMFAVAYRNSYTQSKPLQLRYTSQGYRYNRIYFQLSSQQDFQIFFLVGELDAFNAQQHGVFPDLDTPYSGTLAVRRVDAFEGECPESFTPVCDFEANRCTNLQPDGSSSKVWQILTPLQLIGVKTPVVDHTTETPQGHFYLAVPTSAQPNFDYFLKKTDSKLSTGDQCLVFWYWLEKGAFSVVADYFSDVTNRTTSITVWTGEDGVSNWRLATAPISANPEATSVAPSIRVRLQSNETIAAIDDFQLFVGTCPQPMACNFEEGTCGYLQYQINNDDRPELTWSWVSAIHTESYANAPRVDHTTDTAFGHYLFIDGSLLKANSSAGQAFVQMRSMMSGPYPPEEDTCVEFWYMIGGDDGAMQLDVSMIVDGSPESVVSIVGNSKQTWQTKRLSIPHGKAFQVQLRGIKTNETNDGFIAVDDIIFHEECYPHTTPTTPDPNDFSFAACNFATDFCRWTNDPTSDIEFSRASGRVSPDVGPTGSVSGTGYYIYVKAGETGDQDPTKNTTARLLSGVAQFSAGASQVCMQFYYHMTGPHVDTLQLLDKTMAGESQIVPIWSRSKEQGNSWKQGHVDLDIPGPHQLIFEAAVLVGSKGVIAIDDISLSSGRCHHAELCDFEADTCGWYNDPASTTLWRRIHGTSYPRYGPHKDHTYDTVQGTFMYVDNKNYDARTGIFASPEYRLGANEGCVRLYLESKGDSTSLYVHVVPTSNGIDLDDETIVAYQYSDYESYEAWRRISAPLRYDGTFRIKIRADMPTRGGISIDDVEINLHKACGPPVFCDFETGECGWQNDEYNRIDWEVHSGPTETHGTGPSVDHTLGTAQGSYLYWESSKPAKWNGNIEGLYQSELINPYQFEDKKACFRFWYHMWGVEMGILRLDEYVSDNTLWEKSGNQGNEWKRALVNIDIEGSAPLILSFTAKEDKPSGQSDMAIDDVVLLPGDCSQYDDPIEPQFFECKARNPDGTPVKIPLARACDLVPDCPTYGDDEVDCGRSCTFDDSGENCAWLSVGRFSQTWKLGHGADGNPLGPPIDATQSSPQGGYYFIDVNQAAKEDGPAELRVHMYPTPASCKLQFYYILPAAPNYGNIRVSIQLGDNLFDIFYDNGTQSDWEYPLASSTRAVILGRIHTEFELLIRGFKHEVINGILAVDGVNVTDCIFPMPSSAPCNSASEWTCSQTGSCIPKFKVCDLIDDCGDGSDEADCGSSPIYCNFESDACGFVRQRAGIWYRTRNIDNSEKIPSRDHTTGLNYGFYFITYDPSNAEAIHLPNTYYIPSGGYCELRLAISSPSTDFVANSPLLVKITLEANTSSSILIPVTDFPSEGFGEWETVRVILSSKIDPDSAFLIEIVARDFTNYMALDDIVLTSGCKIDNSDVCLPPDYYRCKAPTGTTSQACISTSLFGDFIKDCPYADDELGYGPCPFDPSPMSTQASLYGWTLSTNDIFEMAHLPHSGTFVPTTDGPPTLNANGWFLLARTKTIRASDDFTMTSPSLPVMSTRCSLRFAFYMFGTAPDERIDVQLLQPDAMTLLDSQGFTPNATWQTSKWFVIGKGLAGKINQTLSLRLKTTSDPLVAAVGIDNIEFSEDCSYTRSLPDLDCDFNDDTTCQWAQGEDGNFRWAFGDGSQAKSLGGPGVDYDGNGKYLFVSSKLLNHAWSGLALLRTPDYPTSKDKFCLQFAYNVYGSEPGNLALYGYYERPFSKEIFTRRVSQGNQWHLAQVTIDPGLYGTSGTYYLMFTGYVFMSYSGYVALDSIKALRGECPSQRFCDFENGQCGWTSDASEPYDFTWDRKRRSDVDSHLTSTSAQWDHTTETEEGYYMQIESQDHMPGERALLKSQPYPIPIGYGAVACFRFWYHMFGPDIASLAVSLTPQNTRRLGFVRAGNHGNHWWQGNIEIRPSDFLLSDDASGKNFTINIEAMRGAGDLGDIAVDDLSLQDGKCPAIATCDFEKDQCGFSNVYELSKVAWLRNNGETPGLYTGPSKDHTYGNSSGYYMFVDSTSDMSQIANLSYYASEIIQGSPRGHCLIFFYHMYGSKVGTLSVQILYPTKGNWTTETVWSRSGNSDDYWWQARVSVATDREYSIVFLADISVSAAAGGGKGDIAIDDISLDMSGPCSGIAPATTTPSPQQFMACGFETTNCGWEAADPTNVLAFQRSSGSEPVTSDAPLNDNTKKDQTGHYFVTYPNSTAKSSFTGLSLSSYAYTPYFTTTQRHCIFGFYYYMSDTIAYSQDLEVGLNQLGSNENIVLSSPYSKSTGNQWIPVRVDLGHQKAPFRFYIKHSLRYSWVVPGTMAFDDISFLDCANPAPSQQACSPSYQFQCDNGVCISNIFLCDGYDQCGDGSDESARMCQGRFVVMFEDDANDQKLIKNVVPAIDRPDVNFAWTLEKGPSYSGTTGPRFDHTFGNATGHYYVTRTPYFSDPNLKAWLLTAPFIAPKYDGPICEMRFYYHLFGTDMGSLAVYYRTMTSGPKIQLWKRTGNLGNFWLRATIDLTSVKEDFEIIIEGATGSSSSTFMAVDDVSFSDGCILRNESLPVYTTTASPPTTTPQPCASDPNKFGCFASGNGTCIERRLVCNFVADCPNGEDESVIVCVANPSNFSGSTLEESGWVGTSNSKYVWNVLNVANIPPKCKGACPTTDVDGNGAYAVADSSLDRNNSNRAYITLKSPISRAGPQCLVSFWYVLTEFNRIPYSTLTLTLIVPNPEIGTLPSRERLWTAESINNVNQSPKWQNIEIFLGTQKAPFYLEFEAAQQSLHSLPAAAALDFIEFKQCREPEPVANCQPSEFRCEKNGVCINSRYMCDFADHCGDGVKGDVTSSSDETQLLCASTFVARCSFDFPAANCIDWTHGEGEIQWKIGEPGDAVAPGYPSVDHTTRSPSGHILLLTYNFNNENKEARYKTAQRVVVSASQGHDCRLRFWFYYHATSGGARELGAVYVIARTSYSPITDIYLANFTATTGDAWLRQEIIIQSSVVGDNSPFELIFLGKLSYYILGGAIAIDDISMTPDCHLTSILLPGQSSAPTTTHAPMCSDLPGSFQCANGTGCYSISQHCNFMNDCQDGSDEWGCSTSCDFDTNSTYWCNWSNMCQQGGSTCVSKWNWYNSSSTIWLPSSDYTSNGTGGGYLVSNARSSGDKVVLQSTVFQHASPSCSIQFMYWASEYIPSAKPSALNVYLKSSRGGSQVVFQAQAGNVRGWLPGNATLYTKTSFEVQFEVVAGKYPNNGEFAIDGLKFIGCSPDVPSAACYDPADFLCEDGSRCIHQSQKCDYTADCRDGSDELESMCVGYRAPGSCTFENRDWQSFCKLERTPTGDRLEWAAVEAGKVSLGPVIDHTIQSRSGHILYVDMMSEDVGVFAKAMLTTQNTYPANPSGSCLLRFYYFLHRPKLSKGSGQIKIFSIGTNTSSSVLHGKLSLGSVAPGGNSAAGYNNPWTLINFPVSRIEPFIIQLIGESDDDPLSVMAIDDVSLTEGCRTGRDIRPNMNETHCNEGELFCESKRFCLAAEWICDGWCDCPPTSSQQTGGLCVDEYNCLSTSSLPGPSTLEPVTNPKTSPIGPASETTPSQPDQTTTAGSGTTEKVAGGSNNLGLILGITFGVVGGLALAGVGAFLFFKFIMAAPPLPGTEPGTGLANPIYGQEVSTEPAATTNNAIDVDKEGITNTAAPTDLQQSINSIN